MRLAIGLLASSCVTQQVAVAPRELLHHVAELRSHGSANVDVAPYGDFELAADRVLDVTIAGQPRRITVRELIANCPEVVPFANDHFRRDPPCLLLDTPLGDLVLETRHRPDGDVFKVMLGGLLFVVVIGTIAGIVCHASSDPC